MWIRKNPTEDRHGCLNHRILCLSHPPPIIRISLCDLFYKLLIIFVLPFFSILTTWKLNEVKTALWTGQ